MDPSPAAYPVVGRALDGADRIVRCCYMGLLVLVEGGGCVTGGQKVMLLWLVGV